MARLTYSKPVALHRCRRLTVRPPLKKMLRTASSTNPEIRVAVAQPSTNRSEWCLPVARFFPTAHKRASQPAHVECLRRMLAPFSSSFLFSLLQRSRGMLCIITPFAAGVLLPCESFSSPAKPRSHNQACDRSSRHTVSPVRSRCAAGRPETFTGASVF